jgi:hypothetical protein
MEKSTTGWYTPGSHPDFWGRGGTYQLISDSALPLLDERFFVGSFDWLPPLPESDDLPLDFDDPREPSLANLEHAKTQAAAEGLTLPPAFLKFMTDTELHRRVPTCTACYLEVSHGLIDSPSGDGTRLLRFLNDQQTVLLWYLQLRPDGGHAVVVAQPDWHEEPEGDTLEDLVDLDEVLVCAPSFEAFLYRFWIENTIWYALSKSRELTPDQRGYLDAARAGRPIRG